MVFGDSPNTLKISKLNSGMLQNFRVDFLWKEKNNNAIRGNHFKWNEYLDVVWLELSGDAKKEDFAQFEKLNKNVTNELSKNKDKRGFEKPTTKDKSLLSNQKKTLMEKEIFLRRLQNRQGKGTAYNEEDDDFD